MYPIRFEPIYQDYVWGADRIKSRFQRKCIHKRIAESWEISDRDDAMSLVANGPFQGKTLRSLISEWGAELLGPDRQEERFPLLLKIIDAKEHLSVQVHPDEFVAKQLRAEPKTEMWISLDEAAVLAGFKEKMDPKKFLKAIHSCQVEDCLVRHELKKGDALYIPAGCVHTICAGSLLFEVQQNSNTTYRLFDWKRKGRSLHLEEGMQAIQWEMSPPQKQQLHHVSSDQHHQKMSVVVSPYFIVDRIDVFDHYSIGRSPKSFQIFFCMEGKGTIQGGGYVEPFEAGMTYLMAASLEEMAIHGRCQALSIRN